MFSGAGFSISLAISHTHPKGNKFFLRCKYSVCENIVFQIQNAIYMNKQFHAQ